MGRFHSAKTSRTASSGITISGPELTSLGKRDVPAPPFDGGIPDELRDAGAPLLEDTTSGSGSQPYAMAAPNGQQPDSDGPIGLFSGKPMRFPFAAIFQTATPSAAASDPDQRSALDDLIWNGRRPRASSLDAVAAPPLAPDRQSSFVSENGLTSSSGDPGAAFPPLPASPDSQRPLSLNDAYLEYLKRLKAS